MVDAVSSVQKYNSSGSNEASSDDDIALFDEIKIEGEKSSTDDDINIVLEKLGIPSEDKTKLKEALTTAGKTSYADILDFLDDDGDGTVETSEIKTAIDNANDLEETDSEEGDEHHDSDIVLTRNGTNSMDMLGVDGKTKANSGDDSDDDDTAKVDSGAKTNRDEGQLDPEYVDDMFNSTSGKAKNSFFKQDLEAFLKPTSSGEAPDAGKLAMILQKMGFAKKDDAGNPVANTELAAEMIEYFGHEDDGDFEDLIDMLVGDDKHYNTDNDDANADVATRAESNSALEKFIKDTGRAGFDQATIDSIARLDVDGKIVGTGPMPATPRTPSDEPDDVYLKRIFALTDASKSKPANSLLQDDIKVFMYNSDPNVIDEAKLATLLQTMGVTGTDPATPPTDLAKSIIGYITSMTTAGTPQDKLLDFLLGKNADVPATTGDTNNGIMEQSEALSVLVQFINHPDRADAKTKTTLPDKGSAITLPTESPIAGRATWEAYLRPKGIISNDPADYDNLLTDVSKANGNKALDQLTSADMQAFFDNDKSGDGVTTAEAILSRFSNSNNGFAISPTGLRTYLATSGDDPFIKGQLLNEYLITIGINAGDAGTLKNMLVDNTNEEIVAFLTAGQADGGKPITPSQIQKNIMNTDNSNPKYDILTPDEKNIIASGTFSGGGAYKDGGVPTTDTQFAGLNNDEMANALKAGLIDIKTYLNMGGDDPNTSDIENDFNKLSAAQKKEKLEVIQKSRGATLENLYLSALISDDQRIANLNFDQAMMITGTDGRAVADANSTDPTNIKADLKDASLLKSGEFFSEDAFRLMAMQYSNEELVGGKLEAMIRAIYKDLGFNYETSSVGKDVVKKFEKRIADGDTDAFNKMIGDLFDKDNDADDGVDDDFYSADAMKNSLNL